MMADTVQEEILTKVQDTYVPFLKLLIPFLEKNKIAAPENLDKLKAMYLIFTTASPDEQVKTFLDNKTKLETWYKKAVKKKKSPETNDNESSQGDTPKPIDDDTLLMHAAQHYGFSLPQPELTVSLEKLSDHVIHSYTNEVIKKSMETTLDQLIKGSTSPDEITIIQKEDLSQKRKREDGPSEFDLKKCLETNIRLEQMNVLENVKEKLNSKIEMYTKLLISESKVCLLVNENLSKDKEIEVLKIQNEEIKTKRTKLKMKYKNLKRSIADKPKVQSSTVAIQCENLSKDKEIEELKIRNEEIEAKYAKLKEKCTNLEKSIADKAKAHSSAVALNCENEITVIGPSLSVNTYKLNCCRIKDFSKFTADLLEVVFGKEMLNTAVLKGPNASSVLNPDLVTNIQMYVSKKFNVSTKEVRAAMRLKLNTCHKAYKRANAASNTS